MSHHSGDTPDRSDFNPRMGRRNREREPTLKRAVIQRLASMVSRWTPGGAGARPTNQRARHDMRPMPALSRRCVVKARYVQMRAGGDKAARRHLAYIERDGVEQEYPLHETTHGGMTGASAQWGRGKQGDLATSRDCVEGEPAGG